MELKLIMINDEDWNNTIEYVRNSTLKAGKSLVKKMLNNYFYDW